MTEKRKRRDHETALAISSRWLLDTDDPSTKIALARLDRVWRDWSVPNRNMLMDIVDALVLSDLLSLSAPQDERKSLALEQVASIGVQAADVCLRLDDHLGRIDPGLCPGLRELAVELASFAVGCVNATTMVAPQVNRMVALALRSRLIERLPAGSRPPSNQLIAELVWLVSGMPAGSPPDESTVRRIGKKLRLPQPARRTWARRWTTIRSASRLAVRARSEIAEAEVEVLLSAGPAPKKRRLS